MQIVQGQRGNSETHLISAQNNKKSSSLSFSLSLEYNKPHHYNYTLLYQTVNTDPLYKSRRQRIDYTRSLSFCLSLFIIIILFITRRRHDRIERSGTQTLAPQLSPMNQRTPSSWEREQVYSVI